MAAGVAAAILLATVAYCYTKLAERNQQLDVLAFQKHDLDHIPENEIISTPVRFRRAK